MRTDVVELLTQAFLCMDEEDYSTAMSCFEQITTLLPDEAIGYMGIAVVLAERPVGVSYRVLYNQVFKAYTKKHSPEWKEILQKIVNYNCNGKHLPLLVYGSDSLLASECLLTMGADVNGRDEYTTALWDISFNRLKKEEAAERRKVAELLLALGAKVDVKNVNGVALYNKYTDRIIRKKVLEYYPNAQMGEAPNPNNGEDYVKEVDGVSKFFVSLPALTGLFCLIVDFNVSISLGLGLGLGLGLLSAFFWWLLHMPSKEEKNQAAQLKRDVPYLKAELFYCACVHAGFDEYTVSENTKDIKNIARRFSISDHTDLPSLYKKGQEELQRRAFEAVEKQLQEDAVQLQENRRSWTTDDKAKTFYNACQSKGITTLTSTANVERLKLLAEQMDCPLELCELKELFQRGKQFADEDARAAHIQQIEQQRIDDQSFEKNANRYINYLGRDKMIKMYSDLAAAHKAKASEYNDKYMRLIDHSVKLKQMTSEPEKDWATAGGIASGIAGGAAGLATALSIQQENAEIRKRNAANAANISKLVSISSNDYFTKSRQENEQADKLLEKAEQAKSKLVAELPQQELLLKLAPTVKDMEAKESGAIYLKVATQATGGLHIFDNVSAVVDGTFIADFILDGQTIGSAYLTLPCNASSCSQTLEGICRDTKTVAKDGNYQIVFRPHHLWAIEI